MPRQVGQVLAGRRLPVDVVAEQIVERGAVAGALAGAAAWQRRVVVEQRPELLRLQEVEPRAVLRRQRPQHRRAQEAEMVVVARIAYRPAAPRPRRAAPRGLVRMPDVEDRLLRERRPALPLIGA